MAQVYKKLEIDVNKEVTSMITAVQNDTKSRYLDVILLDSSTPINLTGHEVRIYGKKADGTEFYNNGAITNASAGRCQFELTSQALVLAQDLEVQIILFKNNVEVLSTQPFKIHIVKSLISAGAVESSNEYGALVVLYQNLYEAHDLMTTMVQNMGVPGEIAKRLTIDTMWNAWEYMCDYVARTLQYITDASSNQGSIMYNDSIYLPKMKWTPPPPRVFPWPNITSNSELCIYGDILYYSYYVSSSTCGIVAIDTKTNKKITEVKGYYVKQMILYNDFLYIADSLTNKVFKLNPASLTVVASTPAFGTFVNAGIMCIGNNKIYMCYTDKYVRILNATTLSSYAGLAGATYNPMSFPYEYNNILYVSQGSYLTIFDATTYKKISETYYYGGDTLESKVIYNDILFVYSQVGKKIMAIELENLTKIYETQGTYQVSDLMIYNKLLYAKGSNGVFAFYPENLDFAGQSETLPSDGYGRMVISKEGVFTTMGSDSTIHLHGHMLGVYGYKEAVL